MSGKVAIVLALAVASSVAWAMPRSFAINGVTIGDSRTFLLEKFPSPISVERQPPQFGSTEERIIFAGAAAQVSDGAIVAIWADGSAYSTDTGVRPGMSVADVVAHLGAPSRTTESRLMYATSDSCEYRYVHDGLVVTKIALWCAQ
jgi:hypothetical protein